MKASIFCMMIIMVIAVIPSKPGPAESAYPESTKFDPSSSTLSYSGNSLHNSAFQFTRYYIPSGVRAGYAQSMLRIFSGNTDSALTNYWVDFREANTSMSNSEFRLIDAAFTDVGQIYPQFKKIKYFIGEFIDKSTHKALAFEFGSENCKWDEHGYTMYSHFLSENRFDYTSSYNENKAKEHLLFNNPDGSYLYEYFDEQTGFAVGIRYFSPTNKKEYKMFFN